MSSETSLTYGIDDLRRIMARLRDPDRGCPWDLKQDFGTIASFTLEETYELIDAIESEQFDQVKDELGDVLFQIIFYAQLGVEQGLFDFDSIVDGIAKKLLRRHPHVFTDSDIESQSTTGISIAEVKDNWERIKKEERQARDRPYMLDDIPRALPALPRAQKLQKRVSRIGFDWATAAAVMDKVQEEISELEAALVEGEAEDIESEMGDLLFSAVNLSRHLGVDAETALRRATHRFEQRFRMMEESAQSDGSSLELESAEQLEARWELAKLALLQQ